MFTRALRPGLVPVRPDPPRAAGEAGAQTQPVTVPIGNAAGQLPARRLAWDPCRFVVSEAWA
jgi:hypothetical protein